MVVITWRGVRVDLAMKVRRPLSQEHLVALSHPLLFNPPVDCISTTTSAWTVYEQVFLAALDLDERKLAEVSPKRTRVPSKRLFGLPRADTPDLSPPPPCHQHRPARLLSR